MKRLLVFVLALILLTACGESEPPYVDNGNPGQVKAVIFYDDNRDGKKDADEAGVQAQEIVRITQELSCVPAGLPSFENTDANGVYEFTSLKPGKYCVVLNNGFNLTTKQTQEVYVSSEQVTTVYFGITR